MIDQRPVRATQTTAAKCAKKSTPKNAGNQCRRHTCCVHACLWLMDAAVARTHIQHYDPCAVCFCWPKQMAVRCHLSCIRNTRPSGLPADLHNNRIKQALSLLFGLLDCCCATTPRVECVFWSHRWFANKHSTHFLWQIFPPRRFNPHNRPPVHLTESLHIVAYKHFGSNGFALPLRR